MANLYLVAASDTREPMFAKNYQNILNFARDVAAITNLKLQLKEMTGNNFKAASIESALKSLNCTSNDVIIFYYSGHGEGEETPTGTGKSLYPLLLTLDDPKRSLTSFDDIIRDTPARLTISIADACNTCAETRETRGVEWAPDPDMIRHLFVNSSASILASAAIPGEEALYDDTKGGYFTNQLIAAIKRPPAGANDWESVINVAKAQIIATDPFTGDPKTQDPQGVCEPRQTAVA